MSALPVLYSFRRCPYAMRARLALAVSGQACELREVVLRDKPRGLLQASPQGTVPVLVLPDGQVLEHSLDIMLWALQAHDPLHWLNPSVGTLEAMLAQIADCDGPFKQALDRCKYPQRYPGADVAAARAQACAWLAALDAQLAGTGHLFGGHTALADAAIFPFVRQFAGIDAAWWSAQAWPHLQRWLERWVASPLFSQTMDKYGAWKDGTPGVRFPPSGAA
ncbi:glutathione S-transferase [Acidovorax sp. SRB_14]|uniref:glutathione S-transferase n=1 Tax=Acidovorax sp. SRB_14 TaxID=1962699 RepID=UPI001563A062|nr:glutathione S-transferase [Acidovorax sp. SRB_14]NMM79728.1 glutathione S-transferase [Acidovorax sp. SRB_14]